jgi:hypothetical protein
MTFAGYRHCAKAISDILQETWKEMTILSFFCECLDVWFVILGKGNPNRVRLRIDGNAVRARGARERRQRRTSIVIETHNNLHGLLTGELFDEVIHDSGRVTFHVSTPCIGSSSHDTGGLNNRIVIFH